MLLLTLLCASWINRLVLRRDLNRHSDIIISMHGISALFIFIFFLVCACALFLGLYVEWKTAGTRRRTLGLIGLTVFVLLWFSFIGSLYAQKAYFHYKLWKLRASDVYSIRIGKHDFTDQRTLGEIVGALHHSRWFEVNHGGWGDSIPLTIQMRSGSNMTLEVALYFQEKGAIIGPEHGHGRVQLATMGFAIAPELPHVLMNYGVNLPDCDTAHGRRCTAEQLNP
jgi:hypothetical protein